jgi:hypothetical protein
MAYRRICLLQWDPDVPGSRLDDFYAWASEAFRNAPFPRAEQGRATGDGEFDWYYAVDFDTKQELDGWNDCEFHKAYSVQIGGVWADPDVPRMFVKAATIHVELA